MKRPAVGEGFIEPQRGEIERIKPENCSDEDQDKEDLKVSAGEKGIFYLRKKTGIFLV